MNTFFGFCIIMFFCCWIWQLKQEVAFLRNQLGDSDAGESGPVPAMAEGAAAAPRRHHAFGPPDPRPKTHERVGGVPTWFIADSATGGEQESEAPRTS